MQYNAYIFDLDGTLYSRDDLVQRVVNAQYQEFASQLSHIQRDEYIPRVIKLDEHGYRPKDEVYAQLAEEFRFSDTLKDQLIEHFWAAYDDHIVCPEDTANTLSALRKRGAKIGVITNGKTTRQHNKINALGISGLLDQVLVSEAEEIKKPDPVIFERALERLGVTAEDAVFIGDHPTADINGARNAGIDAIWRRTPYWTMSRADVRVIDNLVELLN